MLVVNASEFVSVGVAYVCDVKGRFVIWSRTRGAFIPPTMLERGDVESRELAERARACHESGDGSVLPVGGNRLAGKERINPPRFGP